MPAAHRLAELKRSAKAAKVPVVYVNDNFGKWRSDFRRVVAEAEADASKGREVSRLLRPEEDDYFVLKPMHSGFFDSALELLLRKLDARQLVLAGFAGNICVLFTANDAYLRDFELFDVRGSVERGLDAHGHGCGFAGLAVGARAAPRAESPREGGGSGRGGIDERGSGGRGRGRSRGAFI